jgi:hypothetical protein
VRRRLRCSALAGLADDAGFVAAARYLPDVRERSVRDAPDAG